MEQLSAAGAFSVRKEGSRLYANDAGEIEVLLKKYTPLLYKIARSFGFSESESRSLVEQLRIYARTHPAADCYLARIWLSKIMVHLCTFRISSVLFGRTGREEEKSKPESFGYAGYYRTAGEQAVQNIPLSYRAAYILSRCLGFTTNEISLILNTTPSKVMERYHKALAFLATHH